MRRKIITAGLAVALLAAGTLAYAQLPSRSTVTARGFKNGDLVTLLRALRNRGFTKAGLAVATTTTKIGTANTFQYMIDGVLYSKAGTDNVTITGVTATTSTQTSRVRVEINAAGTFSFVQGPRVSTTAPAGVRTAGARSAGKATVGYFDMPVSFTPGTTLASLLTYVDGDPDLDAVGLES